MNKLNKILLVFSFLTALLIMSAWSFVQSRYFGNRIALEINKNISSKLDIDLSFSNIEIDMFPPSTRLKNITIKSINKEYEFEVSAGSLSLTFGISDLFGNKFSIQNVGFEDAVIDLNSLSLEGDGPALKYSEIFPFIRKLFQDELPVKIGGVHLIRSSVSSNYINGFFDKFYLDVYKSVLETSVVGYGVSFNEKFIVDKSMRDVDYLSIDFHLNDNKLLLKKSEFWKKSQNISLEGALLFEKEMKFIGSGYFRGVLEQLDFLKKYEAYKNVSPKGIVEVKSKIESDLSDKHNFEGSLRIEELDSKYAVLDSFYASFKIDDKEVLLREAIVKDGTGEIRVNEKSRIYDFEHSSFFPNPVTLEFKKFHTNSLLYFIEESLGGLKGVLSGRVISRWADEKIKFNILDGSLLERFTLKSSATAPILQNEKIKIHDTLIEVDLDNIVDIDFDLSVGKYTRLKGKGRTNGDKVRFDILNSKLDFLEIGPISGLQLFGLGDFGMSIVGSGEDVNFDFDMDMSEVKILDFNVSKLKGEMGLNLQDLILSLKGISGEFSNTSYTANGFIDFKKSKLNLGIDIAKSDLEDAIFILGPIAKDLDFLNPKYVSLGFKSKIKLAGGLGDNELRVYGIVDGRELNILKEKSESLLFNFDYFDNVLSFSDLALRHSSSEFVGNFKMNTKSQYFEYDAKLVSGQLEDFEFYRFLGLGYSSEISGEFYGKGTPDDFSTRSHVKFTNSFLGNIQVPESLITVYNNSKEVFSSGNFMGDRSLYNLYLNFDENNPQKSYVNASLNFNNIKEFVGIVSNHNVNNDNLSGELKGRLKSSFSIYDLDNLTIDALIEEFIFKKRDEVLRINGEHAKFIIQDGVVEDVNIQLVSNKNNYYKVKGKGSLSKGIDLNQEFKLDSSFLELVSPKFLKSSGALFGSGSITGSMDKLEFEHSFSGRDIFLNILDLPSSFSDVSFDLLFEQNSLMINKVSGLFGKGDIEAKGFVKFILPYPDVDLNLSFSNSYIPLFKKSGVLASGLARIEGKEFPYLLNGSVTILNGTINDELQDLSPPSVSGSSVTSKYIPENKFDNKFDLFDLDLSINLDKPIIVRNLLTDLRLLGNGRVKGKLYKPTVNGVVEVVPGLSKLLFKGNEFVLKEGTIVFSEEKGLVPELNFTSSSIVNQYTINLDVYGLANNPQLNIASDPFLNQEDIFSLLTLGFTSEVSDQLEEKERRSATTLGIGTLLFDQLLKNQGLSSNLGLKLSVLPEFEENESTLLKGKSGVSDSRSGRYKSATKIKLEKKISRNVDLSLASTVGGSAEQKQEMNVNYNILKNVSLEGVYEINSTNEEQSKEPKSFGVDLKIQWTY